MNLIHPAAGYWKDPTNVKRFFDDFAARKEFDPLVPENWYPIQRKPIEQAVLSGCLCLGLSILLGRRNDFVLF